MRSFELETAGTPSEAIAKREDAKRKQPTKEASFLAGGTNLLDLMKLGVVAPARLININPLRQALGSIDVNADGIRLGAMVRMSEAADHPVLRRDYPVLADSLRLAASPQLRNMASLGGNILQRTRCNYFRDVTWQACNKRNPGSGCAAIAGVNRRMAILGVSDKCIANYPGDFAIALVALGAELEFLGHDEKPQRMAFEDLHRSPGQTPHLETNLEPGSLITGLWVPSGPWTRRSLYLKIRDRESYDFALCSAAVALDLAPDRTVRTSRIAIGGLAAKPWRTREAESALAGKILDENSAQNAAAAAFVDAVTHSETGFKPELGVRTLVRALLEAADLEA